MTDAFNVAAVIAAAISGAISILSILMSKQNDISLENCVDLIKETRAQVKGNTRIINKLGYQTNRLN